MRSEDHETDSTTVDKGKGRALNVPTERTPLLGSTSTNPSVTEEPSPPSTSRSLWSILTTVFLFSLCICICAFIVIALLAWSYAARASDLSPQDIINNDMVFQGPDHVDVLNITDGCIWLRVKGRVGMDAGAAIGIGSDPDDGYLQDVWKSIGRWSVRALDRVTVNMTTVNITPEDDPTLVLASVDMSMLEVPLTVDPPNDISWLTPVSIPVRIKPTTNTTALLVFLKNSWQNGYFSVRANVHQVTVHGGELNSQSWKSLFKGKLSNIQTSLRMKFPAIPGLPHPGKHQPFPRLSELLTLKTFSISSTSRNLSLNAEASIINPFPSSLRFTSPHVPFIVTLPPPPKSSSPGLDIASIEAAPVSLTQYPNITLYLSGYVIPLPSDNASFPLLSGFLTRYLSGESNPILITTPLLPDVIAETVFPAPYPRPHVLRNVTIRNMKIIPAGNAFLASGTVYAHVVLPKGMDVGVTVKRILPDVLIFDGEVPDSAANLLPMAVSSTTTELPPSQPLPSPLPERAFGHIRPDDWLPSVSVPMEPEEGEGAVYEVTAKVVDVPVKVLPGRNKEFSDFVGKVIFGSGGALAGIQGFAAVTVDVRGLPIHSPGTNNGEIELSGLPFQGSVRIGKKSL